MNTQASLFDDEYIEPLSQPKENKASKKKEHDIESSQKIENDSLKNEEEKPSLPNDLYGDTAEDSIEKLKDDDEGREADTASEQIITEEKPEGISKEDLLQNQILEENINSDYFAFEEQEKIEGRKTSSGIVFEKPAIVFEEVIKEKKKKQDTKSENQIDEGHSDNASAVNDSESSLPEWDLEDKYYSIGEVSKMFSVNTSHIRFWTTEFSLKPRTTRKGGRLYSKDDIERLRLIYHLVKEKKHTIKGAKEKLKTQKQVVKTGLSLTDSLILLKEKLVEIQSQL